MFLLSPLRVRITVAGTFWRKPLQSRDMARLANREKASLWMGLLSGATPEASLMTQYMRELLEVAFDPSVAPGPPPQRELHARKEEKIKPP